MSCRNNRSKDHINFGDGTFDREAEAHISRCPECAAEAKNVAEMRNALAALRSDKMPADVMARVRASVAETAASSTYDAGNRYFSLAEWVKYWTMPSTAGLAASLLCGTVLLWSLLWAPDVVEVSSLNSRDAFTDHIAQMNRESYRRFDGIPLDPGNTFNLASASEMPDVNPKGALVALTKSLVRGEMRDDEVVVVAEVFGNGLARIAEVVEPSHDKEAVKELEKALQSDQGAPFIPSEKFEGKDGVIVILKIQSVNVEVNAN